MTRQTSIEAYREIKENGLLSKRRWQVYDYLFHNGPATARQAVLAISNEFGNNVSIAFGSLATRFCELRRSGVIEEVGTIIDKETKHEVILWDVTKNLPKKIVKPKKIKCTHCKGKGYFEQGKLL